MSSLQPTDRQTESEGKHSWEATGAPLVILVISCAALLAWDETLNLYFNCILMWICVWICVCEGTAVWPSISIIRKPAMVGRDETLFSEVWEDSSSVFTRVVKVHSETLCQLH